MIETLNDSITAAKGLLGWKLVHVTKAGRISGYIVETEAYNQNDPASHSFRGVTTRTAPMFEKAGTIYVYFTYGMHYCINIAAGPIGRGEAVLIRAIEPVEGISLMISNRKVKAGGQLTNGPGKLTQALGIDRELSGKHLDNGPIYLEPGIVPAEIVQTTRIGITRAIEQPWRFYIKYNPFVSKPLKS